MTEKVKKIYRSGLRNNEFLQSIKEADGDKKPNMFSSDLENFFMSLRKSPLILSKGSPVMTSLLLFITPHLMKVGIIFFLF